MLRGGHIQGRAPHWRVGKAKIPPGLLLITARGKLTRARSRKKIPSPTFYLNQSLPLAEPTQQLLIDFRENSLKGLESTPSLESSTECRR
jgi:hypothetical protein